MYILDAELRFVFVNAFALALWGRREHELLGKGWKDNLPFVPTPEVIATFQHAVATQTRTEVETFGISHRGWVGIIVYPQDGGLVVHVRRLLRNAPTINDTDLDALTGCLTRQAFLSARAQLHLPAVLAVIDLNRLKTVNTRLGHSGGDLYIRQIAHGVREVLPPDALMCRWGGDEFVILSSGENRDLLERALSASHALIPSPSPGVRAFSEGLALLAPDMPFDRAFALADEELQQQKDLLNAAVPGDWDMMAFIEFSRRLEALHDPDEIVQHALDSLVELLDFDHAIYVKWEGGVQRPTHQSVRAGVQPPLQALHTPVPIGRLAARMHLTRQTVWNTDYPSESDVSSSTLEEGVKSAIVTPVFSQGEVIASLVLQTVHRWQTITPHIRKVVELTALRVEHALELRRAVSEVRSTLESGLLTLGIVLEARDLETHGHTQRTARMSTRLGETLGLACAELDHLREGAYLHDLGKLSIPDAILHKPGKLTPDEWTLMKTHTTSGFELASRIPGLSSTVLEVIRHHHERWDGTGYPDRLAGTDIPLAARIFTVCDVYDALVSERPYKRAWTPEAARQEIQVQAGRQFDPDVVQAFLQLATE
ncbi:HD domain-containing phosphohydrolase [Deinococcus altitudinis]|uniref:HD domain-containing phosphohydrolase n=1 Tax=Deinococcus altitudinis TaxID=468914 RepID=UPI0038925EA7